MSITGNQFYAQQNVTNTNQNQEELDDLNTRILQNTVDIAEVNAELDVAAGLIATNSLAIGENTARLVTLDDTDLPDISTRFGLVEGRVTVLENEDHTDLYDRTAAISRLDLQVDDKHRTTINDWSIFLESDIVRFGAAGEYLLDDVRVKSNQNESDIGTIDGRVSAAESTIEGLSRSSLGGGDYTLTIGEEKIVLDSNDVVFGVGGGDSLANLRTDIDTNTGDINVLKFDTEGVDRGSLGGGEYVTFIQDDYIRLASDTIYYGTTGNFTIQGLRTKVNNVISDVDNFTEGIGNNGTELNFGSRGILMNNHDITQVNNIETASITATDISATNISATDISGNTFTGTDLSVTSITATDLSVTDIDCINVEANSVIANTVGTNLVQVINPAGDKTTELSTDASGHFLVESDEEIRLVAKTGTQSKTTIFSNTEVDFDGCRLTNFLPPAPTMRSFSVKVTAVNKNYWTISYNSGFASYLPNYNTSGTPIISHGEGNFSIYVATSFYGGDETAAFRDLHVSSSGIYKQDGDANASIICGGPQITFPSGGSGASCEFNCSRCNNPGSRTWLEWDGYINIMFSFPWI